uniref:Uncharacterized protein n=1 Tax=Arundo donax TaxID=35708 RepID=A0A0A9CPA1_ARUDO
MPPSDLLAAGFTRRFAGISAWVSVDLAVSVTRESLRSSTSSATTFSLDDSSCFVVSHTLSLFRLLLPQAVNFPTSFCYAGRFGRRCRVNWRNHAVWHINGGILCLSSYSLRGPSFLFVL